MLNVVRRASSAVLIGAIVVACGGGTVASNIPSIAVPSFALPSGVLPSIALPSFESDPSLEALIPAQIGDGPVTGISSANFLSVLQAFNPQGENLPRFISGMQSINVDPAAVSFAQGTATIEEEAIQVQVVRFPNGNAANAIDILVSIDEPDVLPEITTSTIGGKQVTVADTEGDIEYYYFNGDLAWFLPDATPEQAEVVFAALP